MHTPCRVVVVISTEVAQKLNPDKLTSLPPDDWSSQFLGNWKYTFVTTRDVSFQTTHDRKYLLICRRLDTKLMTNSQNPSTTTVASAHLKRDKKRKYQLIDRPHEALSQFGLKNNKLIRFDTKSITYRASRLVQSSSSKSCKDAWECSILV